MKILAKLASGTLVIETMFRTNVISYMPQKANDMSEVSINYWKYHV